METITISSLFEKFAGQLLVIDPVTDAYETASVAWVRGLKTNTKTEEIEITERELIRALYDYPGAEAYGDGSYTVIERS